jgi:thiamine pyrophosphate-dependent acetolactate synthase large subunit-like protein
MTPPPSRFAGTTRAEVYCAITAWSATLNDPRDGPAVFSRALSAALEMRRGPVMVSVANDVLDARDDSPPWEVSFPRRRRSQADDASEVAAIMSAASSPPWLLQTRAFCMHGPPRQLLALALHHDDPSFGQVGTDRRGPAGLRHRV